MSLGFTSVFDCGHRQQFPEYQILNERNLVCMCLIFRLAPCFVATARAGAVLLSALACIRINSPISFRIACTKINSADRAPKAYFSDSRLDKATVRCLRRSLVNVTQGTRCVLLRHPVTSPVSLKISRDVFQGLAQVLRFRCRCRWVEFRVTCSFQASQRFLGTCQICKCRRCEFVR